MARGDDKAATKAEHMAAPTSNAVAQLTLANGEPSTQGAKRPRLEVADSRTTALELKWATADFAAPVTEDARSKGVAYAAIG